MDKFTSEVNTLIHLVQRYPGIFSLFKFCGANRIRSLMENTFTFQKDVNGFCPTNYNLQRINGTTLVVRKIKDIANCLERCQLHSIIPTSKFIFQSVFFSCYL